MTMNRFERRQEREKLYRTDEWRGARRSLREARDNIRRLQGVTSR
jgi:hypothetical protein